MLADEIREMSDADITSRIAELEEERFRLKFRSATETLEDPLRLRVVRRDVARLKTVLRERASGDAGGKASRPAGSRRATSRQAGSRKSAR